MLQKRSRSVSRDWFAKLKWAIGQWRAVRGSAHARFSKSIVFLGFALLVGPPFWQWVVQTFFTIRSENTPNSFDDGAFWTGSLMIAAGIFCFVLFHYLDIVKAGVLPAATEGAVAVSIPDNTTFEVASQIVGRACGKNVVLGPAFTPAERGAILKSQQLSCASAKSMLTELGPLARDVQIRKYAVITKGERLILRPIK